MAINLAEAVLVNETADLSKRGDVSLFETIRDAEAYLEPIDVENREYVAYTLDGRELQMLVEGNRIKHVRLVHTQELNDRRAWVHQLLVDVAKIVLEARMRRGKVVRGRIEPAAMSVAELAEFIGFAG